MTNNTINLNITDKYHLKLNMNGDLYTDENQGVGFIARAHHANITFNKVKAFLFMKNPMYGCGFIGRLYNLPNEYDKYKYDYVDRNSVV